MIAKHEPRMLVANANQQQNLERAVAGVDVENPQSTRVGAVLDDLVPIRRQISSEPHYLLAAASHVRDEGLLDEDYDLADKLGVATGDAVMVLRLSAEADQRGTVDEDRLVSEFYTSAERDPHTRVLLSKALEVVQAAMAELRKDDVLVILSRGIRYSGCCSDVH